MRTLPFVFAGGLLAATALAATGAERFVESLRLPSGQSVVVAEGDLEPRSTGSYSLRLYRGRDPAFPLDDFVSGMIRPRDGTIVRVVLADIDGEPGPEIVVVKQVAGSGGYLSADAFHIRENSLPWLASVSGLAPDADPPSVLRARRKAAPKP